MDHMRTLQVKGAMFEVRGLWLFYIGRPDPKVTRKMYFSKYGGPCSQITDADWLRRIRESGLESELETVAISRADRPRAPRMDPLPLWCKGCFTEVFFADDEWLMKVPTSLSEYAETVTPLDQAAEAGDSINVSALLAAGNVPKSKLDEALLCAVAPSWDNTQVVKILLKAGASPSPNWGEDSLEALDRAQEQDSSK
jgi:hypothetical protein